MKVFKVINKQLIKYWSYGKINFISFTFSNYDNLIRRGYKEI